ncbi:MAG: DUF4293 domain-containing protein [Bacteroidia bacterium]|jgi:peptidoglycan/LPS O-acetylase OafA/YrhL
MIQRIQSLYLLAALAVNIIFMYAPLGYGAHGKGIFADNTLGLALGLLTSANLLYSIFLFNNRKRQMLMCKIAGGALFSELALVFFLEASRGFTWANWGAALPVVAIVLVYLAHKAIYRDEQLVRSADRLR